MKYSSISPLLGGVETSRFFHFLENLIEISFKHFSLVWYLGIFRYVNLSEVTSFCSSRHYAFLTVINCKRQNILKKGTSNRVASEIVFEPNFCQF